MTGSDLALFARDLATDTKAFLAEYVGKALGGIANRIQALEDRVKSLRDGETGEPGPQGSQGDVGPAGAKGEPGARGERGESGLAGKDAELALLLQMKADIASMQAEWGGFKAWQAGGSKALPIDEGVFVDRIKAAVLSEIPAPKDGRDGKDVDPAIVDVMVAAQIEHAVKALELPKGELGPPGPQGETGLQGPVGEAGPTGTAGPQGPAGESGPQGEPGAIGPAGQSGDVGPVGPHGEKGLDGQPGPQGATGELGAAGTDGAEGPMGLPGSHGLPGERGEQGPQGLSGEHGTKGLDGMNGKDGRDGIDLADAVVNRDGYLVLTYSDGRTKDVGNVSGRDIDEAIVLRRIDEQLKKLVDEIPKPKDGTNGKDGLGFQDSELFLDPAEGWIVRMKNAERHVDHRVAMPFDAGTFKLGTKYPQGAIVNSKGLWIAQQDTRDKPGESRAWRLLVRNGRDGKDRIVTPPKDDDDA